MHTRPTALFFLMCALSFSAAAGGKKPLDHTVYDGWKRIANETIASDGSAILYVIDPQEGDPALVIRSSRTGKADTIQRGAAPKISYDSRYAAFLVKAPFADTKKAKIAKKKADQMPKDTLAILRFGADSLVRIPRVRSFAFPEKSGGWIACLLEKDTVKAEAPRKKTDSDAADDAAGKEKKDEGSTLIIRRLDDGREFRYPGVTEYSFSKNATGVLFTCATKDSTVLAGAFRFATRTATVDTLLAGKGTYRGIAWDEEGGQAAFFADRDTSKAKQRYFTLYYWRAGMDSASAIADTSTAGVPDGWLVSENRTPDFSKNGTRLYFGTAPVPLPEDTTLNDEETAKLDVWNWQDPFLQTQQVKGLEQEKKRTYLAVIDLATRTCRQLGTVAIPTVTLAAEGNADVALGLSDVPYRRLISWENTGYNDVYLVDLRSGVATRVMEKLRASASISPAGRYLLWYDSQKRHWFTMDVASQRTAQPTRGITVPLYNELEDIPDDPGSYGILGWTANDSLLLVNDRYDIWVTDPAGQRHPVSLTAGAGRKTLQSYRYIRTDPEERFLTPGNTILLRLFDTKTKDAGYARTVLGATTAPVTLVKEPCDYGTPVKARLDSFFIFQKSNFTTSPDLYCAHLPFTDQVKISNINPQQKDYLWGTVELFAWRSADGKPLEGLLYKPEGFDPKKKYPMLVYYYERNSDLLHRYTAPAPSASIINPAWCVSNGYVVFIPDIAYRTGHPGQSAVDCIVPGVKKLIAAGIADPARIGLQGQSWGGYQTAFIVTRTPMFRAAMAGAAVANMTSAYGGIRWESGVSRMFQYEHAQSRIGATLWQRPDLYIENSPLFAADKVTTPLLLMHNDDDGAVPWYQGIEFFSALRRLDKPVWMLTYNGEQHNLVQRKNRKDLSVRMMQFFDHYLKDAPAPAWMTQGIPAINKGKVFGLELEKK
jgi:dipeptidyl aminopeptidase/acylaminoacyl peptidase